MPLGTLALITFIGSWNNFIGPLVVLRDMDRYTLPLALRKTLELVAETGPAQEDLDTVFAPLQADPAGALDGVMDLPNQPLDQEPKRVIDELNAVRARAAT